MKEIQKKARILGWVNREIRRNPTTRHARLGAWIRFLAWHIFRRLISANMAIPILSRSRLLVSNESAAWINFVTGLEEFQDLAFVLHALRPTDTFIDVGANIGLYTVIAAREVGATTYSFEPSSVQFKALIDNVNLNQISSLVGIRQVAIGDTEREVLLTSGLGSLNHVLENDAVLSDTDIMSAEKVPCRRLDSFKTDFKYPAFLKIDVEGYEYKVLMGAERILESDLLLALLVEVQGGRTTYGSTEADVHSLLSRHGYTAFNYEPETRTLVPSQAKVETSPGMSNRLYVRDVEMVSSRLRSARTFNVRGMEF